MVSLIASETVELVDDEIHDFVFLFGAEFDGLYEFNAVSGFGGLTAIDEYFEHLNMFAQSILPACSLL